MKILNSDGIDGPILKKIFSCENCKYLGNATVGLGGLPYKCYHNDIISSFKSKYDMFSGDISSEKTTPYFCPFLFKKERLEKIKNINDENNC
jgi:hypothetical protein